MLYDLRKGFTLIELLVVIAIVGVLAAMTLPNYMAIRERARDTQRKNDLKQLKEALEMYKQDRTDFSYPADASDLFPYTVDYCWYSAGTAATCPAGSVVYLKKIPKDPNKTPNNYSYISPRVGTDATTFRLCTCLENKADTDADASATNCNGYATCASQKVYIIDEP